MPELDPICPKEAVNLYLNDRGNELADATIDSYSHKLTRFIEWCQQERIDNLNTLSGRSLLKFKQYRAEDLNLVSLKGQMDCLRGFIRWCESIDAVENDLHNKVLSPSPNQQERSREVLVDPENAERILSQLSRFEYASLHHTLITLLWTCGARSGTVRSFDIDDFDGINKRLQAKHRGGTPLKNKERGERLIALSGDVCQVLNDYIDYNREDVTDGEGREPLLTTVHGRISKSTIREICYRWTHPCKYNGGTCPHGKVTGECQALGGEDYAPSVCPSSRSPHAWRRGAITYHLTEDVPVEVVSDRMNVSRDVIDEHYDRREEEVKVEQRRAYLEDL